MDFLAQIGVGLVVLLILYIIIKSNKSLEKAYIQETKETGIEKEEKTKREIEQKPEQKIEEEQSRERVERSAHTVASDLVLNQERRKKEIEFYIWTIDAGGRLENKIEVDHYPFTIGRAKDNDFYIDDNSVSSHHAQIVKEEDSLILKDMNSLNKIFVNGRQVLEVKLRDGLCVFLGNTELYFEENK